MNRLRDFRGGKKKAEIHEQMICGMVSGLAVSACSFRIHTRKPFDHGTSIALIMRGKGWIEAARFIRGQKTPCKDAYFTGMPWYTLQVI